MSCDSAATERTNERTKRDWHPYQALPALIRIYTQNSFQRRRFFMPSSPFRFLLSSTFLQRPYSAHPSLAAPAPSARPRSPPKPPPTPTTPPPPPLRIITDRASAITRLGPPRIGSAGVGFRPCVCERIEFCRSVGPSSQGDLYARWLTHDKRANTTSSPTTGDVSGYPLRRTDLFIQGSFVGRVEKKNTKRRDR